MKKVFLYTILLSLVACVTPSRISNKNLAFLYSKESYPIRFEYSIYHVNDTLSRIYFSVNSKDLLYMKHEDGVHFFSKILVSYQLFRSYESKEIIDSSSTQMLSFSKSTNDDKQLIGSVDFKTTLGNEYLMELEIYDVNRSQSAVKYIQIDKISKHSHQNYLIKDGLLNSMHYGKNIEKNNILNIQHRDTNYRRLFVRYYKRAFPIALPPFSIESNNQFNYKSDSTYVILSDSIFEFIPKGEGFYHLQIDTNRKEGLTLYCFHKDYPQLITPSNLVLPLRYITTNQEYETLVTKNNKAAVDEFWLTTAGSSERARDLIKIYYNRVQEANEYYSSYVEGWKTDRGMLYVVLGPPNLVYKSSTSESWIYGEENNLMSITYTFLKIDNPFTDNDYSLSRSPVYKNMWYRAVDTWRQGRVYTKSTSPF